MMSSGKIHVPGQGTEISSLGIANGEIKKGFKLYKWLSDRDVFNCLVSKGFRIMDNLDEEERVSVLGEIFKKMDIHFVQDLIANGLTDKRGETNPVTIAIESMSYFDNDSIVRYLVGNGFSVQAPERKEPDGSSDKKELTSPLVEAIINSQSDVVAFLLKHGAVVRKEELDAVGRNVSGEFDAYVTMFQEANIDLNAESAAVLRAALEPGFEYDDVDSANLRFSKIKTLLDAGANPSTTSEDGSSCGHHFVKELTKCCYIWQEVMEAIFDVFLKHGLDMNAVNKKGETLLHLCDWKNLELLDVLLSRGADPNVNANNGGTVATVKMLQLIQTGEMQKFSDVLHLVIKYNADLTVEDDKHTTLFSALLNVECNYEIQKPVTQLLSVAEMGLLSGSKIDELLDDDNGSTAIPMMQAGCHYKCLLERLSTIATEYQYYVEDGFDFEDFAACVDPFYDFKKQLSSIEDFYEPVEESSTASIASPHPLKCYAVHRIRNQILKANGNRSIIPRARKLPLPQCMIEMVTLECYKMADVEAEVNKRFGNHLTLSFSESV